MLASRYINAPLPPIPAWKKEFGSFQILRDYEQLKHRVDVSVNNWPRELSTPLLKKFDGAWQSINDAPTYREMQPLRDAVEFATGIAKELEHLKLNKVSGDTELCELAERSANLCNLYPSAAEFIAQRVGIDLPNGKHMTEEGRLLRLQCSRWWRRRMRAHFGQAVENAMRSRGLVRRGRAAYCTDWALRRRTSQKQRMRTMMQEAIAINEDGQQFELFDLVQRSVSNPALRRAELMTRIRGFEEIATECGHVGLFGTHTAPSCYHAQHAAGGENKLYIEAGRPAVRAAQQWLCKMWARFRAKIARMCIEMYGFRIAEPHHDGTPHWHTLLFVAPQHVEAVTTAMRELWLSEHGNEHGARKHRCKFVKINPHIGSAAGYIAKYVAKNIDGFEVGPDYEAGGEATTTARRVDAWASTHRIRQFQQIGGAPVGLWREVRKVRTVSDVGRFEAARLCADACDWKGFTEHARSLSLWKETTGECNQYREVKQPSIVGVQTWVTSLNSVLDGVPVSHSASQPSELSTQSVIDCQGGSPTGNFDVLRVRTRLHEWRIDWRGKKQGHSLQVQPNDSGRALSASNAPLFFSSSGASRPLGPVSITVRSHKNMGTGSENAPRGDGLMIYSHADRWFAHRAISITKPWPLEIDPLYMHPYKTAAAEKPARRSAWGPLPSDHLKPAKYMVPR